jgi:hypothetical protein
MTIFLAGGPGFNKEKRNQGNIQTGRPYQLTMNEKDELVTFCDHLEFLKV